MPKYTMRDSTGQLWHDIDDSNFSDFMSTYPDAVIVEKIEDETGEGESVNTMDMPMPEDQVVEETVEINPDDKYRDRIKNKLSAYDPNKILLIDLFEDVPTETRMKLKDSDFELGKSGEWDKISNEGKSILSGGGNFDEYKNKKIADLSSANRDYNLEIAANDEFSSYDGNMSQYNKDLNKALSNVKQGQIPTSVLDGDLGAKIVGHEEEQVYTTLNNLYADYGFKFEETGIGDNIKVFASNGQVTEISLDNWTNAGDKEQAVKLKSFLDLNKGNYNPTSIKKMAALANGDLDAAAMEKIAKDEKGEGEWDWVTNIFKEEKVSDEVIKNFDAVYDADIVKEEEQKLNNQLIDVNKQFLENKAAFNTYKLDLQNLQNDIKQGNLSDEEINERKALLVKTEQDIIATDKRLGDMYSSQIQPLQAQLQIVNAKKYVVEAEKGNIVGITANTILGVGDKISSYFNGGMLALKEDDIEKYWSEDPEQGKKALAREAQMAVSKMTEKYGADVTNEYEQEFNSTVAGGVYTSMVEMGSMMLAAGLTGTGAVGYGALMGLSIAGGEMEEMMGEDFEGLSMKERFGLATTIGVVNGAIEGVGGYFGGMIGGAGAKGISSVVRKGILGKVMGKLAGKEVSKAAIKKATKEIIEEGLETGVYALSKAGLKAGTAEAVTEGAQEVATRSIKQGVNAWKEKEVFDKMATEITASNVIRSGAMGFLAGGPIGVISAGHKASKAKAMDKISDAQYRLAKDFTLNKSFQEGFSQTLQLKVMDPNDSMTQEQANTILRDLKQQGSMMRDLDGMSLTIEGEKKAYTLLQRKQKLQEQIDKATDKAIVKKQREEITQINERLESISLQYNFESAFEAGLEQAREKTEASGKSFTEFNSSKEFEAKMKELGEQDDAGFKGTSGYIDNDGNIYINREAAKNLRDISVGQHELLHGVVGKQLGNVAPETVQGFKNSLTNKELQVVEKRLEDDYGVTSVDDANAEEYFNALVDGVVKGDIVYDENVFTKIGNFIVENILRPMGFSNTQLGFENGRQVYNFVKDYAKQSRRIAQGQQEGFEGEVGDIVAEGAAGRTTGARSVQVKGVDPEQVQTMIDKVANRAAAKYFSGIPQNVREEAGLTRRSYIDSAKSELRLIAEKWDSSRAEFDRYMANTGMQRLNDLAKRLGVKSVEDQTTRITEDTKQIAAEEETSRDVRSEREVRQDERKGVKVREKLPKVYDVDTVVKSIRSKAKGKSFKGKNIKQLKGFALEEVSMMIGRDEELGKSIFKKISKNADLNKAEMLAIQKFINSNIDIAKGSLLEGYTLKFKASGVVNKLLEKFYNKRSVRAKTGPGLNVQIKKPNISDVEFKEAFGITGKDQANWNQKVVASKGGVSDILKGFVRNFDQVISSQEIREQKIIDGDAESASELAEAIPQGFFSTQASLKTQGKNFDEILNDIYGIEGIANEDRAQILGDALRIKLTENPEETIADIIKAVAEGLEIKQGFAYEQVLYDVINDAVAQYNIPGLKLSAGPTEGGRAADIVLTYYGQEIGIEAKKGNARFGSVTAKYDENGNLVIKKDYTFNKLLNKMLKDAKPEIDAYIKEANIIGKRLFGNKYIPIKYITDAMPQEVYDALQVRGFQKRITQTAKVNTDFVSELYWAKQNGTAYIQIQGLGTYYLTDPSNTNLENPLNLDVPPFNADLILSFATGSNTAANPRSYSKQELVDGKKENSKALPGSTGFRRISLRFQPSKITGLEKSSLQLDQPASVAKAFSQADINNQITKEQEGAFKDNKQEGFFSKVMDPNNTNNSELINKFSKMDKALELANSLDQPIKKIRVFDFDDTLATSNNVVFAVKDGETITLNAEEFAKKGDKLLKEGYEFDFTDFNTVRKGKKGPLFDIAKRIKAARGNEDLFVLTARNPDAQQAIYEFLKSQDLEIPLENIVGLGNSTGEAKAQWLVGKAAEGYNDFYFADDAIQNVSAVKKAMSVLDVKSKVQQARGRFSKQMSDDFNKIIEETKGIGKDKIYSEARARQIGSSKGKGKFWIPYSAEDMLGLIYPLLGKGKVGDAQMKFFKENLFNPFSKAMDSLAAARVQLMADFKSLKENLDVPKDLQKEAFDGFTNEQVVRMYIWDLQGMEIPGLSKRDLADARKIIEGNEKLKTFAEELIKINKEDGYPKPSQSWLAGTITTDLIEGLNDVKRPRYLQQWQENVDAIFSKENLNKLEAAYGTKYREALENMLTRMKTGKNRIEGSNRLSDRLLNWINGSVGAIMFFNTRSAVLQLISSINFINWNDNNIYAAGKAFANQKQYWADFKMLMNSNFLVDRRNGLKINISESEIADAAKTSKNKARAVLNYILKKGFLPTQIADSFAIASGGATFYRNRVNTYLSEGMTQADAEAQAFQDFRELAEESQQSSRPDKISQQQASSLGRLLLAFANTPMQYGRLTKRAYQDLVAGRGDRKSNISKIIYYTAVQNLIFNALQAGIQMLGFGDDEEKDEEKEKTYTRVANGMVDSLLRGLGIGGSAVSVGKNFLMDLYERSGRSRPEYVDSIYKLLQFSPPISSKISRLRQAAWMFDSKKRREEIYEKGFALDNPAYEAAGKVISATTNLPVDRVYNKVNNIDAALAEDTETWESIAMLLGWPEWQIKPKPKSKSKSKKGGYKSRSGFKKRKGRKRKVFK